MDDPRGILEEFVAVSRVGCHVLPPELYQDRERAGENRLGWNAQKGTNLTPEARLKGGMTQQVLSPETVRAIRDAEGTYKDIAKRFDLAPNTVRRIRLRLTYKNVL